MRKYLFSFSLVLTFQLCFGQAFLKIEFESVISNNDRVFEIETELQQNETQAVYTEYWSSKLSESMDDKGKIHINVSESNRHTYKDYENDIIFFQSDIQFKKYATQDDIFVIEWELKNETENILGYQCQLATTNFRGRSYKAYFTDEIGLNGGPWKFDGLPGMILKIASEDKYISIEAKSIEVKNELTEIENPYKNFNKFFTYEEFKSTYQSLYKKSNREEILEGGGIRKSILTKCHIECYVD